MYALLIRVDNLFRPCHDHLYQLLLKYSNLNPMTRRLWYMIGPLLNVKLCHANMKPRNEPTLVTSASTIFFYYTPIRSSRGFKSELFLCGLVKEWLWKIIVKGSFIQKITMRPYPPLISSHGAPR